MIDNTIRYSYGPVPSRRLGRSLGINNVPAKVCTYSCVYCQAGSTSQMTNERQPFYDPEAILKDVESRLEAAQKKSEDIDYLTFVPDGEPTLDINLGRTISMIKTLKIPVAVITNGTLLCEKEVRQDILDVDLVSVKIDCVQENIWKRLNRPHNALQFPEILKGMIDFSREFPGELLTETMLVSSFNDSDASLKAVAEFLGLLQPEKAFVSVPTRPPTLKDVQRPGEDTVNRAYQIISGSVKHVECLIGYEGNNFSLTGDLKKDVLAITAVHPLREEALRNLLFQAGSTWKVVDDMLAEGELLRTRYENHVFYLRRFEREDQDK